jgi:long-chain acyl-CoA synthetase
MHMYGMTETVPIATALKASDHRPDIGEKLRSVGKPLGGMKVRIVRPDGSDVKPREVGEIIISGPCLFKGCWNNAEATAKVNRNGWYHSGDAAYFDEDGYIYIHDRLNDMIVSGAENVYPAEVESAIFGHPAVKDVAVIGVPDDKWGEAVEAIIVPAEGAVVDPAEIIAYARERIAGYKLPKSIDIVESLPRNPAGKILKRELRRPYWEGRDRQVN